MLGLLLGGCAGPRRVAIDESPTLKSLAGREIDVQPDQRVTAGDSQAIVAYQRFLETTPSGSQRGEALRRLGDLEMDSADNQAASGTDVPDYKVAVARYQDYLKAYPNDPGNDRVLYQLARAQEQTGDLETALKTLDRMVLEFPRTLYRDEANFRRGELLFTTRNYAKAEGAFTSVLDSGNDNPFQERSLYMQGWSRWGGAKKLVIRCCSSRASRLSGVGFAGDGRCCCRCRWPGQRNTSSCAQWLQRQGRAGRGRPSATLGR